MVISVAEGRLRQPYRYLAINSGVDLHFANIALHQRYSLPAELRTPDTTLCSFKRHLKAQQ